MHLILSLLSVLSVMTPSRTWYPPAEPLTVNVSAKQASRLVLTDFEGHEIKPAHAVDVNGDQSVDLKQDWTQVSTAGAYLLFIVPKDKPLAEFEGTPLVIEVRKDPNPRAGAAPEVTKVIPLEYAVMTTDQGKMTMAFYYDVAPLTVASFLRLARTGFYDKLTFHRILPDFVLQGGDPKGDGTGGPGYNVPAEFNDRPHLPGVLSMARSNDPDSAGSQFFICLDYSRTQHLDHKYTAFGQVTDGMDTMKKLAATPLADAEAGRPQKPPVIKKVEVKPVTAKDNPYATMLHMKKANG